MSKKRKTKSSRAVKAQRRERRKRKTAQQKIDPFEAAFRRLARRTQESKHFSQAVLERNPPGQEKMSAVLGRFIDPFYEDALSYDQYSFLVRMAVMAWNTALIDEDKRADMLEKMAESMEPEHRQGMLEIIGELIERKEQFFASYNRFIVDVEITETEDMYHLAVMSTVT